KGALQLLAADRIITGLCTLFIRPARLVGSAIVLKLSTLLYFHNLLRKRKYRLLFSPKRGRRPGPKGPEKELIGAVVEMKRRNPRVENHCSGAWPGCFIRQFDLSSDFHEVSRAGWPYRTTGAPPELPSR